MRRLVVTGIWISAVLLGMVSFETCGQTFPTKPIRVIVPYPPGGIDPVARMITPNVSKVLGQPLVIENRAGANGMIGSDYVARSAPDGYTLLFGSSSTHVAPIFTAKNLSYDPIKDFTPISQVAESPLYLYVFPGLPFNSVKELLDHAKRNPSALSYGSTGVGSIYQLMGEEIKQLAGVSILHVPYKGAEQSVQDTIGGQLSMFFGAAVRLPHVQAGKLKVLAVLDTKRSVVRPDIPAMTETLADFKKVAGWQAFFGPAGMPRAAVNRLSAEIMSTVQMPDVRSKLEDIGFASIGNSPEQLAAAMKSDIEIFGRIARAAKIEPE
jgi:tripartite-type tricarboxylate transporter receptor subunit TctC